MVYNEEYIGVGQVVIFGASEGGKCAWESRGSYSNGL